MDNKPVDAATVTDWMNGYLRAWDSNAPDDIRALFTDDAVYLTAPFVPARVGVDAIVAGWIEDQDQPGDYTFTWKPIGTDGRTAFVEGVTKYSDGRHYANLWVIVFEDVAAAEDAADRGRASAYTEWYMRFPDSTPESN